MRGALKRIDELSPHQRTVFALGSGGDPRDGNGVVFFGSGDSDFGAGLFVESGQGGLIAGVERIDLVARQPERTSILCRRKPACRRRRHPASHAWRRTWSH